LYRAEGREQRARDDGRILAHSPGTRPRDERLKRDLYERVGVEEYRLVDPDRDAVTIYRRDATEFLPPVRFEKEAVVMTPLLPGFELPLTRVLA
jgi:Uma2 family endonuclease